MADFKPGRGNAPALLRNTVARTNETQECNTNPCCKFQYGLRNNLKKCFFCFKRLHLRPPISEVKQTWPFSPLKACFEIDATPRLRNQPCPGCGIG